MQYIILYPDGRREIVGEPSPEPVPDSVSLAQLLFSLRDGGLISHAEALAAARTGDIPASLKDPLWVAVPDQATREDIELLWAAMYQAERRSRFWQFVIGAGIATEAQLDDRFRAAAVEA